MKRITTYIEAGRAFEICKATGEGKKDGYWAFEDKYIDENGRLTKDFNGISGFFTQSMEETIGLVSNCIKVDALVEAGMDRMEAAIKVVCGR